MIRICFVNSMRAWGGAEGWMLETALALRDRDITAGIIAQPGSALLVRARSAGVPTAAIPVRFDGAPWTLAAMAGRFLNWRPRAVIANLTKDVKAAALAGRLTGVPCRLATRESDFPLKSKAYYRFYFGRLATGVLVNSEATRRTVLASAPWLDEQRVHLLYKGVDLQRFTLRAAAPRAGVVGFAGQLIARKGLFDLMTAWSRLELLPDSPTRRLLIAGQGPLRAEIETWRAGLRQPAAVRLLGHLEDLVPFYHSLDVLTMPSLAEGFGLVAAEAGACGVPVVATRASSLPEIVEDGTTGLLVPPGRPQDLADALGRLAGNPELAGLLGAAAHARVARRFDREATLDRLLALTGLATEA